MKKDHFKLTVLFPRFLTLHTNWTVSPAKPVILDGRVVSKYGSISGVVRSWRVFAMKTRDSYAVLSGKTISILSVNKDSLTNVENRILNI